LRPIIVAADYGTTPASGQEGFDQDFATIMALPSDLSPEEIEQLKKMHGNMLAFAKANSNIDRWQRMAKVEMALERSNAFSGSKASDWYDEQLRSSNLTNLAEMRGYAHESMQDEKQIAFEKRVFDTFSAEQKKDSLLFQARHVSSDQDIKSLSDDTMSNFQMAQAMTYRMEDLRRTIWVKQYQKLVQERAPLIPQVEQGNAASRAALNDVQQRIESLNQKRTSMELAYQGYLVNLANKTSSSRAEKTTYANWIAESRRAENERQLLGGASMPVTTTSGTTSLVYVPSLLTTTQPPVVLPTVTSEEAKGAVKDLFKDFEVKETEKRDKITGEVNREFLVAEKAQGQIRGLVKELQNGGVTDQIPDFQQSLTGATRCYHNSIAVASALLNQKNLSNEHLQTMIDALQKNNQCLGAYLATFEIYKGDIARLYQTQQQRDVQVELARMRKILAQAQTAIQETRDFVNQVPEPVQQAGFRAVVADMEADKRTMETTYQSVLQAQMTVASEVAKTRANEMQTKLEDIVRRRLAFTAQNADAVQLALLMEQLRGNNVNLEAAKQAATEAELLAKAHLRRVQLAEQRQNVLMQQANLRLNPMRTINVSSETLDAAVESKRATLKALVDDLRLAIDDENQQDNIPRLIEQISAFEGETGELADLLQESQILKTKARRLLRSYGIAPPGKTRSVPMGDADNEGDDFEALQEALDELEIAIDEENIDEIPELLGDVELAEDKLGADVIDVNASLRDRMITLRARADEMVAHHLTKGGGRKKSSTKGRRYKASTPTPLTFTYKDEDDYLKKGRRKAPGVLTFTHD